MFGPFGPRLLRPQSVAGKKASKIGLGPAIVISLGFFIALSGLYLIAHKETAVDKDEEKNAELRKKITYQFEKNSKEFAGLLPAPATVPAGFPAALTGKTAVITKWGELHELHWQLPYQWQAELPDQVNNLIIVSYPTDLPGIAGSLLFYNRDKKVWLGRVDVKRTPEMEGNSKYRLIDGALGDVLWAWTEKQTGAAK